MQKIAERVSSAFRLIQSAAEVRLLLSQQQGGVMLDVVNDTLRQSSPDLQAAGVAALGAFATAYAVMSDGMAANHDPDVTAVADRAAGQHNGSPCRSPDAQSSDGSSTAGAADISTSVRQPSVAVVIAPGPYLDGLAVSSGGAVRRGCAMALGALPARLLRPDAKRVIAALATATQVPRGVCFAACVQPSLQSVMAVHVHHAHHDSCH